MLLSAGLMQLHLDLMTISNRLSIGYAHCIGAPVKSADLTIGRGRQTFALGVLPLPAR